MRTAHRTRDTWVAELLCSPSQPGSGRAPFTDLEHEFPSFAAVLDWLGHPEVEAAGVRTADIFNSSDLCERH